MNILSNFNTQEIVFLTYLLIINIATFAVFAVDKFKSKHDSLRISEASLLILTIIGGSTGALLSMTVFRHKTSKKKFTIVVPLVFLVHKILELAIFNYLKVL